MKKYRISYQSGKWYRISDGDHIVADQLTEQEANTLIKELTDSNQPKCINCGSTKFALIKLTERTIEYFDENNKPVNFIDETTLCEVIKCCKCQTLLERKDNV